MRHMCWKCDLIAPVCRFHAGPEWMFDSNNPQKTRPAESTCPPVLREQRVAIQSADSGGTLEPRTDLPYDAPRRDEAPDTGATRPTYPSGLTRPDWS